MLEHRQLLTTTYFVTTTLDVVNPSDGKLSLREAINAANANPGPDIIVLKTGTYKITIPGAGEDKNQTGDFDILDSVTIKAGYLAYPVIDGNGFDRVFDIPDGHSGLTVEFNGLTIRGGNVDGDGGGVRNESAPNTLRFIDNKVTINQATGNGGGVFSEGGNLSLLRSHVDSNSAGADGGGVFLNDDSSGSMTLTRSTVNSNSASGAGGGIRDNSTDPFSAYSSQISHNQAFGGKGGGAYLQPTSLLFDYTTVSGNTATDDGGGVESSAGSSATTTIRNGSLFSENYSDDIGGGFNGGGRISVIYSSFIHNTARAGGGGINQDNDGNITINYSTFSRNVSVLEVGGAIWTASNGTFAVNDSRFSYNTSGTGSENNGSGGGGAINTAIPLTVRRSTFDHNSSATEAGAIGADANLTVIDCCFTYNRSNSGEGGGAISTDDSDFTALRSQFTNNIAAGGDAKGGGVYSDNAGTVTITNCTLSHNSAGEHGGGLSVEGDTLKMSGTTVDNNNAHENGGGVYLVLSGANTNPYPGTLGPGSLIINSTIGANGAAGNGGGIYFNSEDSGDLTIINATIAFNAALTGGGVFHDTGGTVHVGNTIIAKNTATTDPDVSGAFDDLGHNLIFDLGASTGFTNGAPNIIGVDPKLGPLAFNGGPTQTYALLFGSPAINAADDLLAPPTDQRGVHRPQGAHADIGAFEKILF